MNAFHSLWTKPAHGKSPEEFEILTMVLSALKWREKNGKITMVTDSDGARLLEQRGLCTVWDDIKTTLDDIPDYADPDRFWAAGKIYALRGFDAPVVSIDTDFIVWEPLELEKTTSGLIVIHRETLRPEVYPNTAEYADYDDGFSWTVLPANTAFVYFGRNDLISLYTAYADGFIKTCRSGGRLCPMVFAEQRLLSMTAHKMGIKIDSFSSLESLMNGKDNRFTHLWGYKRTLRSCGEEKSGMEARLRSRIMKDFPQMSDKMNSQIKG
ncbi:MAG: hypothetical protein J6N52_05650 [Clostridia bacterium]|nr:hypothetical protein [Clostridia bacterium]